MKDLISHAGGKLVRLTLITTQLNRSPHGPLIFTDAYLRLSKGLREIAQSESDIRPLDLANAVQVIKDIDDDCRYPPTQTTSNVD